MMGETKKEWSGPASHTKGDKGDKGKQRKSARTRVTSTGQHKQSGDNGEQKKNDFNEEPPDRWSVDKSPAK